MQTQWYETFFQGVALDMWRAFTTPEMTREEVDFLVSTLELSPGARVLDVPCGGGRHSLELARRGYRVTGVDISEEFIAEARSGAGDLAVEFRLGDMRNLPGTAEFDGAFCWGNSFGYLDPAGTQEFLGALGRALKPGARLVIDTGIVAEAILLSLQGRPWWKVGDILMLIDNQYRVEESRLDTTYTFVRDGKTETRPSSQYVFTVGEIRRMLAQAGFQMVAVYGGLDRSPFQLGGRGAMIVGEVVSSKTTDY